MGEKLFQNIYQDIFQGVYRGKTVLVTGHSGFKGSWLVLWLKAMGANVIGYSLAPNTDPSHRVLLGADLGITDIYEDVRNANSLAETVKKYKPEIVFHMAAQPLVRDSYLNPRETIEINVMGSVNLYEACRAEPSVRAIVTITTDKVYENKEQIAGYKESDRLGGHDPYSSSKAAMEIVTASYCKSFFNLETYKKDHNILLAVVRAGNVIGGGDWAKDRLIPDLVRRVKEGETTHIRHPEAIRPWQHVLEPLSAYLLIGKELLLENTKAASQWNIGPDTQDQFSVGDIITKSAEVWNKIKYQITPEKSNMKETNLLQLDCSKISNQLSWKPIWNTAKAVEMTIDWYREYYDNNKVISQEQLQHFVESVASQKDSWIL